MADDGIEATAPKLEDGLDVDRDYDWKKIKVWGLTVGYTLEVEIIVSGVATDNVGLKYIYIEVDSTGIFDKKTLYPQTEEEAMRYEFEHKFEFGMSICSLVSDFWSGWDIYVNISDESLKVPFNFILGDVTPADVNGNTADKKDHLSSVIGALLDAVKDAIKALASMIKEWLINKIKSLAEKVIKSILTPFKAIYDILEEIVLEYITIKDGEMVWLLEETGDTREYDETEKEQDRANQFILDIFGGILMFFILLDIIATLMIGTQITVENIFAPLAKPIAGIIGILVLAIVGGVVSVLIADWITLGDPPEEASKKITQYFGITGVVLSAISAFIHWEKAKAGLITTFDSPAVVFAVASIFLTFLCWGLTHVEGDWVEVVNVILLSIAVMLAIKSLFAWIGSLRGWSFKIASVGYIAFESFMVVGSFALSVFSLGAQVEKMDHMYG